MPTTHRTDEDRKRIREQERTDHERYSPHTAQRALQLTLLRRFYSPRHQPLHRRTRESPQGIHWNPEPEDRATGCETIDCKAGDAAPEPADHEAPLTKDNRQRLHQPGADYCRTYSYGCKRKPDR